MKKTQIKITLHLFLHWLSRGLWTNTIPMIKSVIKAYEIECTPIKITPYLFPTLILSLWTIILTYHRLYCRCMMQWKTRAFHTQHPSPHFHNNILKRHKGWHSMKHSLLIINTSGTANPKTDVHKMKNYGHIRQPFIFPTFNLSALAT